MHGRSPVDIASGSNSPFFAWRPETWSLRSRHTRSALLFWRFATYGSSRAIRRFQRVVAALLESFLDRRQILFRRDLHVLFAIDGKHRAFHFTQRRRGVVGKEVAEPRGRCHFDRGAHLRLRNCACRLLPEFLVLTPHYFSLRGPAPGFRVPKQLLLCRLMANTRGFGNQPHLFGQELVTRYARARPPSR